MSSHSAPADTFIALPSAWTRVQRAETTSLPAEERDMWLTSAVASLEYANGAGYGFLDRSGTEHAVIALRDGTERIWGVYDFLMGV
jgi:hypothetical protein